MARKENPAGANGGASGIVHVTKLNSRKPKAPRNGNQVRCEVCGKKLTARRRGRTRRFCSNTCRQAAFRNAKFEKNFAPTNRPQALRNASETPINSTGCKSENGDRGFGVGLPRNILGGYRWLGAIAIKTAKLRAIIHAEIGWTDWPATEGGAS